MSYVDVWASESASGSDQRLVAHWLAALGMETRSHSDLRAFLAQLHARFATLSRRERQVMALVTAGRLNKQIGAELGVSEVTVKAHRGAVMRKMAARSLTDLVRMADAIGGLG